MLHHISVASYDESAPAHALAERLRREGFETIVRDDSQEQVWMLYNVKPRAHWRVDVPIDTADAVFRRMAELDRTEQILAAAIRCPSCQSTRVKYPQFSRRTVVGSIPAVAAAAGVIARQFFCDACQFTWSPDGDGPEAPTWEMPEPPAAPPPARA